MNPPPPTPLPDQFPDPSDSASEAEWQPTEWRVPAQEQYIEAALRAQRAEERLRAASSRPGETVPRELVDEYMRARAEADALKPPIPNFPTPTPADEQLHDLMQEQSSRLHGRLAAWRLAGRLAVVPALAVLVLLVAFARSLPVWLDVIAGVASYVALRFIINGVLWGARKLADD